MGWGSGLAGPQLEGGSKIITREAENRRQVAGERIWCTGGKGRGSHRVFVYDFVTSPISCTPGWPGPYYVAKDDF